MKTKKLVCYNCGGHGFITATYESGQTSAICPVCGGIGTHEIQMTNADRIRAMSDEELAKLLCCTGWRMIEQKECLEWLQQPAEEDVTMPDLKPCPFCGSKNIRLTCWGLYRCWCVDCLSQATDCISKKEAIEAWNRRAGEEDKHEPN